MTLGSADGDPECRLPGRIQLPSPRCVPEQLIYQRLFKEASNQGQTAAPPDRPPQAWAPKAEPGSDPGRPSATNSTGRRPGLLNQRQAA